MSLSFGAPIETRGHLPLHSGMDEQRDGQGQNGSAVTTRGIKERLQALQEKTSELNETLDGVEKTLAEANESKETNR